MWFSNVCDDCYTENFLYLTINHKFVTTKPNVIAYNMTLLKFTFTSYLMGKNVYNYTIKNILFKIMKHIFVKSANDRHALWVHSSANWIILLIKDEKLSKSVHGDPTEIANH